MNGISYLKNKIGPKDYVLIQYGAAPFTSRRIVDDVIRVMKQHKCAVSATPCYQLLGTNDSDESSENGVDRDNYIQIACPYGFQYEYILNVYERAAAIDLISKIEPHTTSLIYALGEKLYKAYGDQTNIKITTKEDIALFEGYAMLQR